MYGLAAAPADVLSAAMAVLPDCYSQELSNCLDHNNVNGLPKAECDALSAPYDTGGAAAEAFNKAVNALPICKGPSMVPYVGGAFLAGVALSVLVLRKR